jgi:segregation and condensation protein B
MTRTQLKQALDCDETAGAPVVSETDVSEEVLSEETALNSENAAQADVVEPVVATSDEVGCEPQGEESCEDVAAVETAALETASEATDVLETAPAIEPEVCEEAGNTLEAADANAETGEIADSSADAAHENPVEIETAPEAEAEAIPASEHHVELTESGVVIEHLRMTEALLFAASEPLSEDALKTSLPEGADVGGIIAELQKIYEKRGVTLARVAEKWQFRTAPDLAFLLRKEKPEQKKLSRAAIETLAIIAYHQPVTRAEVEDIRGVMLSKGTLDALFEVGWIKIRGRKRTPGRPVTYGTTEAFLVHFGLENISHLPGMDELKAAGFLEAIPPSGLDIPNPSDQLGADEDPYEGPEEGELATGGADPFSPGSSEG